MDAHCVGCQTPQKCNDYRMCLEPHKAVAVTPPAPPTQTKITTHDPVSKPAHYDNGGIEPLEFIMSNNLPFPEGSIVKYVVRWRKKGGKQDLMKAREYLDRLIAGAE